MLPVPAQLLHRKKVVGSTVLPPHNGHGLVVLYESPKGSPQFGHDAARALTTCPQFGQPIAIGASDARKFRIIRRPKYH
jgi:hypothetical protein